jgi:hypothetical protein
VVRARAWWVLLLLAGCASDDLTAARPVPALDVPFFRCQVQPVLVARCAFLACHGSGTRYLRVYAPNRLRENVPPAMRNQPLTSAEEAANLASASGFVGDESHEAWLLAKPLDQNAGGLFHRGQDLYGGDDVFVTRSDPGYQLIDRWIQGETAPASCTPTEAVGP